MPLQSAVDIIPLTVARGGTGAATLTGVLSGNGTSAVTANAVTQNGVLIGGASNAVASLGVASTGQVLIGSTGAAPAFTSTPAFAGAISAGGNIAASAAAVGSAVSVAVTNTDNTNGASNAVLSASVGGTSGGDPEAQFIIPSGATWSIGADNSASDDFVIAASAALGTSNAASWSTAGALTNAGAITATAGNIQASNGNLVLNTAGNKIVSTSVGSGTAAGANSFGSTTLTGGTAIVATTAVTASSIIFLSRQSVGATGANDLGILSVGAIVASTSFEINAWTVTNATALQTDDVSVIGWMIVN